MSEDRLTIHRYGDNVRLVAVAADGRSITINLDRSAAENVARGLVCSWDGTGSPPIEGPVVVDAAVLRKLLEQAAAPSYGHTWAGGRCQGCQARASEDRARARCPAAGAPHGVDDGMCYRCSMLTCCCPSAPQGGPDAESEPFWTIVLMNGLQVQGAPTKDGGLAVVVQRPDGRRRRYVPDPSETQRAASPPHGEPGLPPWDVAMERDRSIALWDLLENVARTPTVEAAHAVAHKRHGYTPGARIYKCRPPAAAQGEHDQGGGPIVIPPQPAPMADVERRVDAILSDSAERERDELRKAAGLPVDVPHKEAVAHCEGLSTAWAQIGLERSIAAEAIRERDELRLELARLRAAAAEVGPDEGPVEPPQGWSPGLMGLSLVRDHGAWQERVAYDHGFIRGTREDDGLSRDFHPDAAAALWVARNGLAMEAARAKPVEPSEALGAWATSHARTLADSGDEGTDALVAGLVVRAPTAKRKLEPLSKAATDLLSRLPMCHSQVGDSDWPAMDELEARGLVTYDMLGGSVWQPRHPVEPTKSPEPEGWERDQSGAAVLVRRGQDGAPVEYAWVDDAGRLRSRHLNPDGWAHSRPYRTDVAAWLMAEQPHEGSEGVGDAG